MTHSMVRFTVWKGHSCFSLICLVRMPYALSIICKIMTFPRANFTYVSLFRGPLSNSEEQLFYSSTFLSTLSYLFQPSRNMGFFVKSLQLTQSYKTVFLQCFHTLVLFAFSSGPPCFLLPISP